MTCISDVGLGIAYILLENLFFSSSTTNSWGWTLISFAFLHIQQIQHLV